jgi:hypothetical protein
MFEDQVLSKLNNHFWFTKYSKTSNGGKVVHHSFNSNDDSVTASTLITWGVTNRATAESSVKELTIIGINYKEKQILDWVVEYSLSILDMAEVALVVGGDSGDDNKCPLAKRMGTYMVKVNLASQIPNVLPIQGKYIRISYPGIEIQCKDFYAYHKKRYAVFQNQI